MDFNELSNFSKIGLEGATCVLMLVFSYKLYKMKLHTLSKCCKDRIIIETMNKGTSSRDLEFSSFNKHEPPSEQDKKIDIIESQVI